MRGVTLAKEVAMRGVTLAVGILLVLGWPSPASAQATYEATVSASQSNVRAAPRLQAPVLKVLPRGTVLPVLGKEGEWYRVRITGHPQSDGAAFVHESTVRVEELSAAGGAERSAGERDTAAKAATDQSRRPQAHPELQPGYRDPERARFFSYFAPGGGHFYTGERGKALEYFGLGVGSFLVGRFMTNHFERTRREFYDAELGAVVECIGNEISTVFCEYPGIPKYIGFGILGLAWVVGISDARPSADRMNARSGILVPTTQAMLQPSVGVGANGRLAVGASITW